MTAQMLGDGHRARTRDPSARMRPCGLMRCSRRRIAALGPVDVGGIADFVRHQVLSALAEMR